MATSNPQQSQNAINHTNHTKRPRPKQFVYELYPSASSLLEFLTKHCGIQDVQKQVKSRIDPEYGSAVYHRTMEFYTKAIIHVDEDYVDKVPRLSAATDMTALLQQYLRSKTRDSNYDARASVATQGVYRANRAWSGSRQFVPLQGDSDVVVRDQVSDSINYLSSNRYCSILHQMVGDDIIYFLLFHATLFVPVLGKTNQWWQLLGTPASDVMWNQRAIKRKQRENSSENRKRKRSDEPLPQPHPSSMSPISKKRGKIRGYRIMKDPKRCHQNMTENESKSFSTNNAGKTTMISTETRISYQCNLCNKQFQSQMPFVDHIQSEKHRNKRRASQAPNEWPITCALCDISCSSYSQWKAHINGKSHRKLHRERQLMKRQSRRKSFKPNANSCSLCCRRFTSQNQLVQHLEGKEHRKNQTTANANADGTGPEHDDCPITCILCNISCPSPSHWKQHINGNSHRNKGAKSKKKNMGPNMTRKQPIKKKRKNAESPLSNSEIAGMGLNKESGPKSRRKAKIIPRNFSNAMSPEAAPSSLPLLGRKRKAAHLNLYNPRRKYRRLNGDSAKVFDRMSAEEERLLPRPLKTGRMYCICIYLSIILELW